MQTRNTIQKNIIFDAVQQIKNHPTADQIHEHVAKQYPSISRATVYRVLEHFAEEGKIKRVEIANAPDRFDFTLHPHAHFHCTQCKRVFDLPLATNLEVENNPSIIINKIEILASGICADCAKK